MFQSRMNISAKSSPSPLRLRGVSRTFARKRIRVPPPFISNKAASLIVAPDKTVFVGDRNPFTPTQIDRKRFPFARPVHRETTLPLPPPFCRGQLHANRFLLHGIERICFPSESNLTQIDLIEYVHLIRYRYIIGNNTWWGN